MSIYETLRGSTQAAFEYVEEAFDALFGGAINPLRHLGALGLYFLWIDVASGLYLYTVLDTSIVGVYDSIGWLSTDQWYLGGVLRSLHRYAADAFILMMLLHLLKEWAFGHYRGFRLYSWVTGIPLIWLAFFSGIGGYWIVWDRLAQFSATATTELLDWLPFFNDPVARNFLTPESVNDRFFTVLVFIHIGVPLLLILGLWAHVNRISHVDHFPARPLALATLGALLLLALAKPAISDAPADLSLVATGLRLDWFILFLHPLTDLTSPALVWSLLLGTTILLFLLPLLPHLAQQSVAVVNAANCNGCSRCLADCPYAAITMEPHPDKPGHKIAIVDADSCASCGLCAGSCPSSTPFRSQEELVTGIDMPQRPVNALRREIEGRLARLVGNTKIIVFGCEQGANVNDLVAPDTAVMGLTCTGMLPPSFVEYALRGGADGVLITTCRNGGCAFRLGDRWTTERLARQREPQLRGNVPTQRLLVIPASTSDGKALSNALQKFKNQLELQVATLNKPPPYSRRTIYHGH